MVLLVQEQHPDYSYEFGSQWNDLKVTQINGVFQLACTGFGLRICANLWACIHTHKKMQRPNIKSLFPKKDEKSHLLGFLLFLFFTSVVMVFGISHFSQSHLSIVNRYI